MTPEGISTPQRRPVGPVQLVIDEEEDRDRGH